MIVRILTPAGRGAIGVVGLVGPSAVALLTERFRPRRALPLAELLPGELMFGDWLHAGNDAPASQQPSEEVVVCRATSDEWEIHCHGGPMAAEAICSSLMRMLSTVASSDLLPSTLRSDLLGIPVSPTSHPGPLVASAWQALSQATTERVAAILLDQVAGALAVAVQSICNLLRREEHGEALEALDALLAWSDLGSHLLRPWRVAIGGPPNVGKSSLLNALAGFDRAIVLDQPGTTRDVVAELIALEGWPVEIADTAGIRDTSDQLETLGVSRARAAWQEADLLVRVRDVSHEDAGQLHAADTPDCSTPTIWVANKSDRAARHVLLREDELLVSALNGEGVDRLRAAIVKSLVPSDPTPGMAIPWEASHIRAFRFARVAILRDEVIPALQALEGLLF